MRTYGRIRCTRTVESVDYFLHICPRSRKCQKFKLRTRTRKKWDKNLTFPRKICRGDLFLLSLDVRRISLQLVAFSKTLSFVFALNSLISQRKNRVGKIGLVPNGVLILNRFTNFLRVKHLIGCSVSDTFYWPVRIIRINFQRMFLILIYY